MIPSDPICIWGAALRGRGIAMMLKRRGLVVDHFVDKSRTGSWKGIPIRREPDRGDLVILGTAAANSAETIAYCKEHGIQWISPHSFCPHYPTIDTCDLCGLKCRGCPRPKGSGWMPADLFSKILGKMISEIPWLYMVDLFCWGDPLCNPELPEIVACCNVYGVASNISTNLMLGKRIAPLMDAEPTGIRIAISGYGVNHDWSHVNGDWQIVERNMREVSRLNRGSVVEVLWQVHKRNAQDSPAIRSLCSDLGFTLKPFVSAVFQNYVADLLEGTPLPDHVKELADQMLVPIERLVADSRAEAHKRCQLMSAYPNIDPRGRLNQCCAWTGETIGDYLTTPLSEIPKLRDAGEVCRRCKRLGLGRYFELQRYAAECEEAIACTSCP